jgi:hypothetical protein
MATRVRRARDKASRETYEIHAKFWLEVVKEGNNVENTGMDVRLILKLILKLRGAYRILAGKAEGRRPLGRPRRRWEDNTKMDLQEVGWGAWI